MSGPTVGDRVVVTGSMFAEGQQLRGLPGRVVGLLVRVDGISRNVAVHGGETVAVDDLDGLGLFDDLTGEAIR